MARARELWLILRARNEATGAIRGAARSLRALEGSGSTEALTRQRQQVLNSIQAARRMRDTYREQQRSYETGAKALQLEKQRAALDRSRISSIREMSSLEASAQRLATRRMTAEKELANFQRLTGAQIGRGGLIQIQRTAPGMTRAETLAETTRLRGAVTALTHDEEASALAMRKAAAAARDLTIEERRLVEVERANAIAAQRAGQMADEQAARMRILGSRARELYAQLQQVPTERWEQFGRTLRNVGRALTITGGVALGVMGIMAKQAAEMATEATTAATQIANVNLSGVAGARNVAQLAGRAQDAVLKQMRQFPASGKDMTDTLYNIYSSMNATFGQGTRLLHLFNQAFLAGGMRGSLEEVSNALITLGNNWKINAGNMAAWKNLVSSTMATIRFGRLDIEKYTQTMNQLAPAFHGAHQSVFQMNAAIAFLTRQLPSSRMSATGLARLMETLARIATPLKENFGVAITDATGNLLPLSQIIGILIKQFPQLTTSGTFLTNFFKMVGGTQSTVQSRRALQGLVLGYRQYQGVIKDLRTDMAEFDRSQRALMEAPGVRFATFQNRLKVLEIQLGAALLPLFDKLGKVVNVLIGWWDSLGKGTQRSIAQFAGWVAVGTIVVGVLTSIAGVVVGTIGIWRRFGGEVTRLIGPLFRSRTALKVMGDEAGFISLRLATGLGIVALIPLMIHFHKQTGYVIDKLGGLDHVLTVLSITIGLIKLQAFIRSLKLLGDTAVVTSGETAVLNGNLGRLSGVLTGLKTIGPIEIVIAITIAEVASQLAGPISRLRHWLQDRVAPVRWLHELQQAGKNLPVLKQLDDMMNKTIGSDDPRRPQRPTGRRGLTPGQITRGQQIIAALPRGQRGMTPGQITSAWNAQQQGARKAAAAHNAASTSLQHFMRIFMRLRQLQAQFAAAPTIGLAKQIDDLQNKMKKASPVQQAYFQQLEQSLGAAKIISDSTALAMGRNVDRLRKAFERAPSTRAYQAWFQANKQFTTMATSDQQQFANDMVSAHQQALEKIKEAHKKAADAINQTWQTTLQFIRGLYNQFLGEMQTAFGQLGQGPVVQGLSAQVQKIRDAGSKQAQALRDQAQKIQDGAKDAEKSISATEGNLIDWGLMLDPGKMKGNTDAAVKALNDRADAIEKAANVRADKLQKRLDEHKLTPRELVRDQQAQLRRFQTWQRHLQQLAARGMPPAMVNALRALGPDFDNMLKSILSMTPRQFRQYTRDFTRAQRIMQQAALKEVRDKLREYRAYGRNIPQAIAAGIQDEAPSVTRALRQLTRETLGRPTMRRLRRLRQQQRATRQNTTHVRLNTTALGNNTAELKRNTAALGKQKDTPARHTQVHRHQVHVRAPRGPRGMTPGQIVGALRPHARRPRGRRGMTPGQIVRALHDNTRHVRTHTGRVQHNSTRVQHNSGILTHHGRNLQRNSAQVQRNTGRLQTHGTRVQHNSRRLDMWGRAVHNNSTHVQHHSTRLQHNSTQLISLTTAVKNNTKALERRPRQTRPHVVHHVDPRRHQNPPQHVHHETNTYHYHADRSHHMSYEQWLRKQHFLHRNQRRC